MKNWGETVRVVDAIGHWYFTIADRVETV